MDKSVAGIVGLSTWMPLHKKFKEEVSEATFNQFCLKEVSSCFFFCCFTSQVNSYGHGGTVSSPNHTFYQASLNKQLTTTLCTYFRL